jgi:hypothetical protein
MPRPIDEQWTHQRRNQRQDDNDGNTEQRRLHAASAGGVRQI